MLYWMIEASFGKHIRSFYKIICIIIGALLRTAKVSCINFAGSCLVVASESSQERKTVCFSFSLFIIPEP